MLNSDLSLAARLGGREPPTDKTRVVSTRRRVLTNWLSSRTLQASIESDVASSFVPSVFLVDGQVSRLGTVHPIHTLDFMDSPSSCCFPLSYFAYKALGDGAMDDVGRLLMELATSSSCSAHRQPWSGGR